MGGDKVTREEVANKIKAAKQEAKTAGKIHRRDLYKHIKRLEKELNVYDRFRAEAARG